VRIDGLITDDIAENAIAQLLFLQDQDATRPITLLIESEGGGVVAGMAIVDTVRTLRPPIHTRAPTRAHGIALIILASGRRGERKVGTEAELSFSPIESPPGFSGDLDDIPLRLAGILAELCGQPLDVASADFFVHRSISPSDAVDYGLVDRVEP
jgi:ATP-dependent Clp protease protease subunit